VVITAEILLKSGKAGGAGNFLGEIEENLVGVEVRDEARWMDPFGVFSKYRGEYGVPKGFDSSLVCGAVLGGVIPGVELYEAEGLADIGRSYNR